MIEFRQARRADTRLLILLAGGTGSGKTESAMRLATGLAGGKRFVVIDTEHGRALHKADDYAFDYAELEEPFTPERYTEAVKAAAQYPAIVIDSGSHEYEGIGGVLDIQAAEFARMGEKEGARMSSWIEPKRRHKRFVQELLRSPSHVILCLRAEDKVEILKVDGKTVVRPKESLTGAQGWIPICEKRLPFEATISLLLLQAQPGVPVPIKLEERFRGLVPLDAPLSEETGRLLGQWAAGTAASPNSPSSPRAEGAGFQPHNAEDARASGPAPSTLAGEIDAEIQTDALADLVALADRVGAEKRAQVEAAIVAERSAHGGRVRPEWVAKARKRLEEQLGVGDTPQFVAPAGAVQT